MQGSHNDHPTFDSLVPVKYVNQWQGLSETSHDRESEILALMEMALADLGRGQLSVDSFARAVRPIYKDQVAIAATHGEYLAIGLYAHELLESDSDRDTPFLVEEIGNALARAKEAYNS